MALGTNAPYVERVLQGLGKITNNLLYLERASHISFHVVLLILVELEFAWRLLVLWWEENRRTRRNTIGTRRELKPDELNPHLVPGRNPTRASVVGGGCSQNKLVSRALAWERGCSQNCAIQVGDQFNKCFIPLQITYILFSRSLTFAFTCNPRSVITWECEEVKNTDQD